MKSKLLLGSFGALAIAGLLAGCAGSTSPQASNALPSTTLQTQSGIHSDGKCGHNHGVSVRPCKVTLTTSNPTATVTAKGPSGGTFTVRDARCTTRGIASVSGGGSTYLVTAGLNSGSCEAKFIDKDTKGHKIGIAQLSISNHV